MQNQDLTPPLSYVSNNSILSVCRKIASMPLFPLLPREIRVRNLMKITRLNSSQVAAFLRMCRQKIWSICCAFGVSSLIQLPLSNDLCNYWISARPLC